MDGGFYDFCGGFGGDGLCAVEAEELAALVAGFYYSVCVEREAATGVEREGCCGVVAVVGDAQRKRAGELDFFAVEIGRQMAGVGQGDLAFVRDVCDQGGGEASVGSADEALVQCAQDAGRGGDVFGDGAQGADEHGDEHGGGKAFASYVAYDGEDAAVAVREDLEEVATDLLCGFIDRIDAEAGGSFRCFREG